MLQEDWGFGIMVLKWGVDMPNEQEMRLHRCCFAGPRFEVLHASDSVIAEWIETEIRKAIKDGYTTFITGMSMGTDILAGEIVVRLKAEFPDIKLIAISPYPGFEQKWRQEHRKRYRDLIRDADLLKYAAPKYAVDALEKRGAFLIRHSARILLVNGRDTGSVYEIEEQSRIAGLDMRVCTLEQQEELADSARKKETYPMNLAREVYPGREITEEILQSIQKAIENENKASKETVEALFGQGVSLNEYALRKGKSTDTIAKQIERIIHRLAEAANETGE